MNIFNIDARVRISFCIVLFGLLISFAMFAFTYAQEEDPFASIIYPIAELGDCESRNDCETYCNDFDHINECIAFAEAHDLFSEEDLEQAKKFAEIGTAGPGDCTSQASCDFYCEDITHIEECLAFGEEHDLIPEEELAEARKVARAIEEGAVLPGGCTSKNSCELYCNDEAHIEECFAFGEAAGLIPPEELEMARKFIELLKNGETPGGCVGERECEAYCENPDHFDECITFAEKAGFIPPEELELLRKTGGKGPGDCLGREECENYCNDPANQEVCFAFATEHGLISEEDLEHARGGFDHVREGLSQAPPEVRDCLRDTVGEEVLAKIESGEPFMPSGDLGEKMRHCFESVGPDPSEFIGELDRAPVEVRECIAAQLGGDYIELLRDGGFSALGPEAGQVIPRCFEEFGGFGGPGIDGEHSGEFGGGFDGGFSGGSDSNFNIFDEATPEILGCFSSELGFARYTELRDNNDIDPSPEDIEKLKRCYGNFNVEQPPELDANSFGGEFVPSVSSELPNFGPHIEECVARKLGEDYKKRLYDGTLDRAEIERVIRTCIEGDFSNTGTIDSPIACTQDARQCPDGSYVGRVGPNCEFAKCQYRDTFIERDDYPIEPTPTYPVDIEPIILDGAQILTSPAIEKCLLLKLGHDYKERFYSGRLDSSTIDETIRKCAALESNPPDSDVQNTDGSTDSGVVEPTISPNGTFDYINAEPSPRSDVPLDSTNTDTAPTNDGTSGSEIQSKGNVRNMLSNAWQAFVSLF